ncbi:MAG: hypothetical protein M0036_03140 [Desulfobacteraceae bacterium]|nr:hypothetical protein [Desulfobacteraceae bacterium]
MKSYFVRLKFKWLLYALYRLIRFTAWRSDEFKAKLLEKDLSIVMKSKDDTIARTIHCYGGKVRTQKGQAPEVVSRIVWDTPEAGVRVMTKMIKGVPKALATAVIEKDLHPQGDAGGIRWFIDLVTLLGKAYRKKKPGPK